MSVRKYQIEIPSEFYKRYISKFESEKSATDYLELSFDTIARSHRTLLRKHKHKELETKIIDIHIHEFLCEIFEQYCTLKKVTPRHIAVKIMNKIIIKK